MRDVRSIINEVRALTNDPGENGNYFVPDQMLQQWIWEGANHFALEGQLLQFPYQFQTGVLPTGDMQQEYALPFDEGDILRVTHYDGATEHDLIEIPIDKVQIGTYAVANRPQFFYKKLNISLFADMLSTGALQHYPVNTRIPDDFKYALGIFPIPSVVGQVVTVTMAMPHPQLRADRNKILLPFTYHFGVVSYVCFKALSKEKAYAEAKYYQAVFDALLDKCKERAQSQARAGHARMKRDVDDDDVMMGHRVIPTDTGMIGA